MEREEWFAQKECSTVLHLIMMKEESITSPKLIYLTANVLVWLTKQDEANDTKLNGPKETKCIYQDPWEIKDF